MSNIKKLSSSFAILVFLVSIYISTSQVAATSLNGGGIFTEYCHMRADSLSGPCLNVYGTETIENNRPVNVYSYENVQAQKWMSVVDSSTGYSNLQVQLRDKLGKPYVLEVWTGKTDYYKADVYEKGAYPQDAALLVGGWQDEGIKGSYTVTLALKPNTPYLYTTGMTNLSSCRWGTNITRWYVF